MTMHQLMAGVAVVALAGAACNRTDTNAQADRAAGQVKEAAARAGDQLDDSWLTTKIQAQYFADDDVRARHINVSTRDGVVTLTGRVESEDGRRQALEIARNTDGVRQVNDQLRVGAGPAEGGEAAGRMDSAWITTKIQAKYFTDPKVSGREIDVTTVNGTVTLSGTVDSEQERQQALALARGTEGVTRVEDRLAVAATSGAVATTGGGDESGGAARQIDDARISTLIQSKFYLDDQVKGRRIDVDTRQGVVTLRGEVASEAERAQALLLARSTTGVQRVEDALTVNAALASGGNTRGQAGAAGTGLNDAFVTTKIQSRFFLDDEVKKGRIEVTTTDGVVLLQGTVPSEGARQQALALARNTGGVVQVVDRLTVRP